MKLPLKWLKNYIDPKLSTDELIERLTMAGLEIETVEAVAGDTVLEIEITPNRPDLLSILGLAREIGAITGKVVKAPKAKVFKTATLKKIIHIESIKDCSRYIGTLIKDVKIKEAPGEMIKYLASLGTNAINNAVDITNFVLMETGQPLHAFDFDKLDGGKIIVRRARNTETIVTLDGIERKLDPSILVIADAKKPVAIAGVMGGMDSQITSNTRNILLESAHFDMGLIRRACRTLGIRTDSSYRFERNVDFDGVLTGAVRATDLLVQFTGGRLTGRGEVSTKNERTAAKIKIQNSDIEDLLGTRVPPLQTRKWLTRLGFKLTGKGGTLTVTAPKNRTDIQADVDVLEEIARMIGFDHLPSKMPTIKAANIAVDKRPRAIKDAARRVLMASGINEIITLSTISTKALIKSNLADIPSVRILNPLSQDQEIMRPSMIPSLLQTALTNINRGQKDLRFYEFGKRYFINGEKETLGILVSGRRSNDRRASKKEGLEVFDLKGVMGRIFRALGIDPVYEPNQWPVLDPSCAMSFMLNGKYLGSLGRVDRKIVDHWDIKNQDVYYAGLHLDEILPLPDTSIKYQPISEFPAITRDVSLAVKKEVPYKKIEDACLKHGGEILRSVNFIEQYLGDKIQSGYKGLVFSCLYQSNIRTLREDEVAAVHERILQALTNDLAAIRR